MGNPKEKKRVQKLAKQVRGIPTPASGAIGGGTFDINTRNCAIEEKGESVVFKLSGTRAWEKLVGQADAAGKMPILVAGDKVVLRLADFVDILSLLDNIPLNNV